MMENRYTLQAGGKVLSMKVNLQELAGALSQSDMHQGYIDIASGRVISMRINAMLSIFFMVTQSFPRSVRRRQRRFARNPAGPGIRPFAEV
jgi:hypothetical protein